MELEKELLTQMRYVLYTGRDLIEPLLTYEESEQSISSLSNHREGGSVPADAVPVAVISTYQPMVFLEESVSVQPRFSPAASGNTVPADLREADAGDKAESGLESDREMRGRGERPMEQRENAGERDQGGKPHSRNSDAQPPPLDAMKETEVLPDAPEYDTMPHKSLRDMQEGTQPPQDLVKPLKEVIDRSEVSMEVMGIRVSPLPLIVVPRQPEVDLTEPELPQVPLDSSAMGNTAAVAPAPAAADKGLERLVVEETQPAILPQGRVEFPPVPSTEEGKVAPAEPEDKGKLNGDLGTSEEGPQRLITTDQRDVSIPPETLDSGKDTIPAAAETLPPAKPELLGRSDEGSDGQGLDSLQPAQSIADTNEKVSEIVPIEGLPADSIEHDRLIPESTGGQGNESLPPAPGLEDFDVPSLLPAQEPALLDSAAPIIPTALQPAVESPSQEEAKPKEIDVKMDTLIPATTDPMVADPAIQDSLQPGPQLSSLSLAPPIDHTVEERKSVEDKEAESDYERGEDKGNSGEYEAPVVAEVPQAFSTFPEKDTGHSGGDPQLREKSPPASHNGEMSDGRQMDSTKPEDQPTISGEVRESQLPVAEGSIDAKKEGSNQPQLEPDGSLEKGEEAKENQSSKPQSRPDELIQDQKKDSSDTQSKPDDLPAKSEEEKEGKEGKEGQSPIQLTHRDGRNEDKKVDISGAQTKPEDPFTKSEEAKESQSPIRLQSSERKNEVQKVDVSGVQDKPGDLQAKKDSETVENRDSGDQPDSSQSPKDAEVLATQSEHLQPDASGSKPPTGRSLEDQRGPHGEDSPSGIEDPPESDEKADSLMERQQIEEEKESSPRGIIPAVAQRATEPLEPQVEGLVSPMPKPESIEVPESPHQHELAKSPFPLLESESTPANEGAGNTGASPTGRGGRPHSPLSFQPQREEAKAAVQPEESAHIPPKLAEFGSMPAGNKGSDEGIGPRNNYKALEAISPVEPLEHGQTPPEEQNHGSGNSRPETEKMGEAAIAPSTVDQENPQVTSLKSPIKPSDESIPTEIQREGKLVKGEGEQLEEAKEPEAAAPTPSRESLNADQLSSPRAPSRPQSPILPPVSAVLAEPSPPQPPLVQTIQPAAPVIITRAVGTAPGSDDSRPCFRPMVTDSHKKLEQGNALTPYDTVPAVPHFPTEAPSTESALDASSKLRESGHKREELKEGRRSPEATVPQSPKLLPHRKDSEGKDSKKDTEPAHQEVSSRGPALHTNPAHSPIAASPESMKLPPISPRAEPANPQSPGSVKPNPLQVEPTKAIPTGKLPPLHKEPPTSTDSSKKPQPQNHKSEPSAKPNDTSRERLKEIPPSPIVHKPTIEVQGNGLIFPGSSHYFDAGGEMVLPRRNRYMDCFSDEDSPVQPHIEEFPLHSSLLDSATLPPFTQPSPKDPSGSPVHLDFDSISRIHPTSPRDHTKQRGASRKAGPKRSDRSLDSSASEGHFLPPINSALKIPTSDADLSRDSRQFSSSDFEDSDNLPHVGSAFLSAQKPDARSMNLLQLPKAKGWSGSFSGRAMSGADPYNRFYSSARSSASYLSTPWTGQYHPLLPITALRKLRPKKRKLRTRSPPNPYEAGWNKRVLKQYFSLKLTVQPFTAVPTANVEKVDKEFRTSSEKPEAKRKRKTKDVKEWQ